jgi:peptidoglycan/xylan/chitin deacetylase (PgdA/CDA1 family)
VDAELTPMPLVLMYHSVEPYDSDPFHLTVEPRRFNEQLRWLHGRGLRGVSVAELLWARQTGGGHGLVGLTFDDGYTDFVTHVMPALARYGFTATVFVIAGALGGHNWWDEPAPRKRLMTAADVLTAVNAGMEIGSHSLTHRRLPELDEEVLAHELTRSRAELAALTGGDVTGFCYPYGAAGEREVAAVREAGYDYACHVQPAPIAGRYAMPRTYIGDKDNSPRLYAKWARHRLVGSRGAR